MCLKYRNEVEYRPIHSYEYLLTYIDKAFNLK
jgi:hypothetical protein